MGGSSQSRRFGCVAEGPAAARSRGARAGVSVSACSATDSACRLLQGCSPALDAAAGPPPPPPAPEQPAGRWESGGLSTSLVAAFTTALTARRRVGGRRRSAQGARRGCGRHVCCPAGSWLSQRRSPSAPEQHLSCQTPSQPDPFCHLHMAARLGS